MVCTHHGNLHYHQRNLLKIVKLFFSFVAFFFSGILIAQTHTQMWLRGAIQHDFTNKISATAEYNHRTQSEVSSESLFRYPLCHAARLWITYKLTANQSIHLSPYAFFSNDPVVNKAGDELKENANEHRLQLQYESKYPWAKKWSIRNREGIEYRIFEKNPNLLRFRIREGIAYQLSNTWNLMIYDEFFLNTIQTENGHAFDQNRLGLQGTFQLNKSVKFDLGTNWILAKPRISDDVSTNYMFYIHMLYRI